MNARGIIMVFEHHMIKLKEIDKCLNNMKYDVAKNIIDKHLENELKGNSLLNNLRGYVNEYQKVLEELRSDMESLEQDKKLYYNKTKNKELRVAECKGKVELAKQQLGRIKEIMAEAMNDFEE
jgi:hypothetical protein